MANAGVVIKLFFESGYLAETASGVTNAEGSYVLSNRLPYEGFLKANIEIAPPAGSGLAAATVNDSTEYVEPPAPLRTITVLLSASGTSPW